MVSKNFKKEAKEELEMLEEMFEDTDPDPKRDEGCHAPGPFPEIKVLQPNAYYAELLLEDYTGIVSELTAIHQYMHHSFAFGEEYEDLAELEACIGIAEMEHLEMLGETIKLLGVDPKFRTIENNTEVYWDSSHLYYGNSICDRLAADVAGEKAAIENYTEHYYEIADPYVKAILSRIIRDEQFHIYLLYRAMEQYGCLS